MSSELTESVSESEAAAQGEPREITQQELDECVNRRSPEAKQSLFESLRSTQVEPGQNAEVQRSRRVLFNIFQCVAGHELRNHRSPEYMGYWHIAHREDVADILAASLSQWIRKKFPDADNVKKDMLFLK